LAALHRGHTLRAGGLSDHALARRLRLFDFDVFFFGTAMFSLSLTPLRVARSSAARRWLSSELANVQPLASW
jgi:hypothetical protein